jgi:hypothetical protein
VLHQLLRMRMAEEWDGALLVPRGQVADDAASL